MITAIFTARDEEAELALALASLIAAATEGLLREVVVVDGGSRDGTCDVADAAGCVILAAADGGLKRAVAGARGDWLLFLTPSVRLEPTWQGEAAAFVEAATIAGDVGGLAATFRLGRMEEGLAARLDEWRASARTKLLGAPRAEQGLLAHRRLVNEVLRRGEAVADAADIARAIGRKRLTLLRSRALRQRRRPAASGLVRPSTGGVSSASDARRGAA